MKNFTRAIVALTFCVFVSQAPAQLVGNENVKANFGIDADVYADTLTFGTFSVAEEGTDDWFDSDLRNTGEGVIDTNGAAALKTLLQTATQAQRNRRFEKRMSYPINSVVNGTRWLDAVYGRDNFSAASENDSSVFVGTSDKNFHNPKSWSFGIGGTPQKNDIIDIYAHIRRNGTSLTDSLWGFGGASTVSQGGSNHIDFEFFRAFIQLGANSQLIGLDVDSGHTAWKFNADGSVNKPGDIIFSFDFENGGTNPVVSIRLWLKPTDVPGGFAAFNSLANRKFNFTGTFNTEGSGTYPSAPYGYAEITTRGSGTFAFARTSRTNEGATPAAPWGTLVNPGANYTGNYEELSFSEFGINLTAFGLDQPLNFNDPCIQVFGSLGVKTRSSTSFTAELKDFSGPYVFGRRLEAVFEIEGDAITCLNPTIETQLIGMNPPPAATTIIWSGAGLVSGQGTPTATWNSGGWKYANVTINGTDCGNVDSFFVEENIGTPNVNIDPAATLTCTTTQVTLTVHSTVQGATFEWSGGGTGTTKNVTQPGVYSVTGTDPSNGCTASATVSVSQDIDAPGVTIDPALQLTCTRQSVTLTAHSIPGATFQWSGGGTGNTKVVGSPGNYTITATDPANGCTSSASVSVSQDITPPGVTIDPALQLTCTRQSVTLTAHSIPGATFQWSGGGTGNTKVVGSPGNYTVTATDPDNGCTSSASVNVSQNITPPNVGIDQPQQLTCTRQSVTLHATSTTPSATFTWSGGGTGADKVVSTPGPYTVTATDPANGCTASASVNVSQNITPPNANAGSDGTISCTSASFTLMGSSTTITASYQWTRNGNVVGNTAQITVSDPGTYVLRVTNTNNGCVARDTAIVTLVNDQPNCSLSGPGVLPLANSTGNQLTASIQNAATITWYLTSNDGNWIITGGQGTPTVTYTAGGGGSKGTFKVVLSNVAGTCRDSCEVEFYAATGGYHCTLTQGAYGNPNGKFCKVRRIDLIKNLTITPLTVGILRTRSLTFDSSDVGCILLRLPAGGPPAQLPPMSNLGLPADMEFLANCNTLPVNIPTWNNKFRNVFLGQVITMGLNLRLGTGLDTIRMLNQYIITGGGSGGGGCGDTSIFVPNGSVSIHTIPQSVLNYLGTNNTVLDLYNLANLSLAGLAPPQPNRSHINQAVSAINEAFDGCRALVGFTDIPPSTRKTDEADDDLSFGEDYQGELEATAMNIIPNPFGASTNVSFMLAETKQLKVEVIDMTGRLVRVLFNGTAEQDIAYITQFDSGNLSNGMYIVRLSTEDLSVQKRIVLQR